MSREVRMVPKDWQHPKDANGNFVPLLLGYAATLREFEAMVQERGMAAALDYFGEAPKQEDYMPEFSEAPFYMMYETVTEGTPISPAFASPEELAHWLADTNASALGDLTASYEAWLRVCKGGFAPSAVCDACGFRSGVDL